MSLIFITDRLVYKLDDQINLKLSLIGDISSYEGNKLM